MRRVARQRWAACAITAGALLAACSSHNDDASAITPDDQRQLNQAAAILDANSADSNVAGAHESSPHD